MRQYVLLGAGLDTFAYRNPHAAAGLRVFEVDHPATQEWKRQLVSHARLKSPGRWSMFPSTSNASSWRSGSSPMASDADEPAFFSWLGVTMYLSQDAIRETLRFVAQSTVSRSGIVFDYLTAAAALGSAAALGIEAADAAGRRRRGAMADLLRSRSSCTGI